MEKKDNKEEISIDFSSVVDKIKKTFSSNKADSTSRAARSNAKEGNGHAQKDSKHKDNNSSKNKEQIEFDLQTVKTKVLPWLKKNYLILLLLIPILLSIFIRIQPAYLPLLDEAAEGNIRENIKGIVAQQINAQYPNLPQENKDQLVEEQLKEIYDQGTIPYGGEVLSIDQLVEENAALMKEEYQDEYGLTYLAEIDPWYFYRLTENYLDHGFEWDIELNGKYYDNHQFAGRPLGTLEGETKKIRHFHVFVEAYLYKLVSLFIPDVRLMTVVFFLPVLLATISVIPAFFIVRRIAGDIGGLVTATAIAVHPLYVGRTIAGFSDTDGYTILFPLFIMWFFIEAMEAKNARDAGIMAVLAGLFVGIFSYSWGGWWYIYDFLLGVCLIVLWYLFLKEEIRDKGTKETWYWIIGSVIFVPFFVLWKTFDAAKRWYQKSNITSEEKSSLTGVGLFLISSVISVISLSGFERGLMAAIDGPLRFTTIKDVGLEIWPNVLTTVAEFNPASLTEIMGSVSFGFMSFIVLAFFGVGYVLFENKELEKDQEAFIAGTIFWVLALSFIANKINNGIIFAALVFLPFAYLLYRKAGFRTLYLVGIPAWYATLAYYVPNLAAHVYTFFIFMVTPIAISILHAIVTKEEIDLKYASLLLVWFVGTIYASTKGNRFIMILMPAFSVAFGLGVAFVYRLWAKVIAQRMNIKRMYIQIFLIIAIAILLFIPITNGFETGKRQLPLISDAWYEALDKINKESAPDAIVNSWWDFGHWFKAIADRAVTFDGGSQNTPQAHWIGRVLLTGDEHEAVSILRMLNCGADRGYFFINEKVDNQYHSLVLLKEMILVDKEGARQMLIEHGFADFEEQEDILRLTHCYPPEDYFITSQDMVAKAAVWGHFGSWDFAKSHVVNSMFRYPRQEAIQVIAQDLGVSVEEATELYNDAYGKDPDQWISPWPSYVSMPTGCWQEGTNLFCEAGMQIDLITGETFIATNDGNMHPKKFVTIDPQGEYKVDVYEENVMESGGRTYSGAIIPSGDSFTGFFMDTLLAESMFTKMFFFKGHGLECFDLFDHRVAINGDNIYVWKVDWECSSPNVAYTTQQQVEEQ